MTQDDSSTDQPSSDGASGSGGAGVSEPGRKKAPWRRRVLTLGLVLVLGVLFLLQTAPGNRLLWNLASQRIEQASGLQVSAQGVRLSWGLGLVARNLEVRTGEGDLFVRVKYLVAEVPFTSILGMPERVDVRRLEVEGLWVDLVNLPESSEAPSAEPDWQLDIADLVVRDGEISPWKWAEPLRFALGTAPVTLSEVGAGSLDWQGHLRLGRNLEVVGDLSGQLFWQAEGIQPTFAEVRTKLVVDETSQLSLENWSLVAAGLRIDGGLECESFSLGPCGVEGDLELLAGDFLSTQIRQQDKNTAGSLRAHGQLDLLSWLGQLRVEVAELPLSFLSDALDAPNESMDPSAETWVSSLRLQGVVSYQAEATMNGAAVEAHLSMTARGSGVPTVLGLEAEATGGGLDENGRVDPWQVAVDGTLQASGSALAEILPLVTGPVQELVVSSGLAGTPFTVHSKLHYQPTVGGSGSLAMDVGEQCGAPGAPGASGPQARCVVSVRAEQVGFVATDGVPDWKTLEADFAILVQDFPGDALASLVLEDERVVQRLRGFARGKSSVSVDLKGDLEQGVVGPGALQGRAVWSGGASSAELRGRQAAARESRPGTSALAPQTATGLEVSPPEILVVVDLASVSGKEAGGIAVGIDLQVLPEMEGERSFHGVIGAPEGLDSAKIRAQGTSLIAGRAAPLLRRTASLAGDASGVMKDLARALLQVAPDSLVSATAEVEGPLTGLLVRHQGELRLLPETVLGGRELATGEGAGRSRLGWSGHARFPSGDQDQGIGDTSKNALRVDLHIADAAASPLPWLVSSWLGEKERPSWFPSTGSLRGEAALAFGPEGVLGDGSLLGEGWRFFDKPVDRVALRVKRELPKADPVVGAGRGVPWRIEELTVETPGTYVEVQGTVLSPSLDQLPEALDLRLKAKALRYGIDEIEVQATLEPGPSQALRLRSQRLKTRGEEGRAEILFPLGALAALQEFEELAARWKIAPVSDPIHLDFYFPYLRIQAVDLEALEAGPVPLGREKNFLEFGELRLAGDLRLDAPGASEMTMTAASLGARYSEYEVLGNDRLRFTIADGRAIIEPFRLQPQSLFSVGDYQQAVVLDASAELGTVQSLHDFGEVVRDLSLNLSGPMDLALFQRFLSPARAAGLAQVQVSLRGPPNRLSGVLNLEGENASVQLLEPYVTRFDQLSLAATIEQGTLAIESLSARLNQGTIEASGVVAPGQADLKFQLDGVRYRVDYGLSTQLSGALLLRLPLGALDPEEAGPARRGKLTGEVQIDRGLARREIDLERELRTLLFAPTSASSAVDPLVDRVDLDLRVTTAEGIRVRNNVADLRVSWDELRVRGTLAQPLVKGEVEAEPGGIVTAYGQVVRVDRGELRFTGQPGVAPEIEVETTSSLQDPSIKPSRATDLDPFSTGGFGDQRASQSASQAFTGGLADYFGSEVGKNLGRAFGGLVNVRPILVFGETEPSARLIVTREVDERIDIGVSLGLRNAEDRLYLVDIHELPVAPTLSAQVFTNEDGNEGATLQQNLELGGTKRSPIQIGQIRLQFEEVGEAAERRLSRNKLRRDLSLRSGDTWYEGAAFDAEIDISSSLRENFFPSPMVEVEVTERGRRRDLLITVRPGIPAEINFVGLRPAKVFRAAIRLSYRSDFFQEAALQEMREQTRLALEAEGWMGVRVRLAFQPADQRPGKGDEIILRSSALRKVTLDRLEVAGLDQEGALAVESALTARGSRVALAAGDKTTKEGVLAALAGLGWLRAELGVVAVSEDGKTLELSFERGRRARIADIRMVGPDETTERGRAIQQLAGGALLIAPGDPVVERELARAAIKIEDLLRDSGYGEASVSARVVRLEGEQDVRDPLVQVRVDAGPLHRIRDVLVPETGMSAPGWVRRQLEIEPGEVYDRSKVQASRSRLLGTGVFSTVSFETLESSSEDLEEIDLALRLTERSRWSLAYGLRWQKEEGLGVVVDVRDRNFAGRGLQVGGRALWTDSRQAGRLFAGVPSVFGSAVSMDAFIEARRIDLDEVESDVTEGTFQLSAPLSNKLSGRGYLRYRIDEELDRALPGSMVVQTRSPIIGSQLVFDLNAREGRGGTEPVALVGTSGSAAALFRGLEGGLGTFASLDLSTSAEFLGSDFDFVRGFAQIFHARRAFSFGTRQFVWAQSWRLGAVENRGRALPREQRFFAGGEYSVRGYGREALGPRELVNGDERALGGEAVLVINQELRFPLLGDVEGVVFFDTGNVWSDTDAMFEDLLSSAGIGVRFRSPLGLLRMDVAFPLDRRDGDDSVRFYLGFGHVF